jgi:ribosomal protein S18 acetylase RimI-like enzyme
MPDFLIVDENLRAAMQFFGKASGAGCIQPVDGGLAIYSGLDYGVFNISLLTRPVADGELEKRLAELGRFFRQRTLRWSVWLCEDMLDSAVRRNERQIFANYGMRPISQPPGMLAPSLRPPLHPLPEIEVRPVVDRETRAAFAEITCVAFEIPYAIAQAVYSRERAWVSNEVSNEVSNLASDETSNGPNGYEGFVGYVDGRAASIVAVVAAAGAIGIYSLATMPEFRKRGYAEAMLREAVRRISERTGITQVILQSTEAGYELYKRMGFRDVTRFTVYLTK